MLIRSPPSGPSSPLSCSSATCASAHMRCVCVREGDRESGNWTDQTLISYISWCFCFRASRLRWLASSAKPRPGGSAVCCRFPPRHCRPSSLTESQSVASRAPVTIRVSAHVRADELSHPQETTYDRIYCPLSVESAIESR